MSVVIKIENVSKQYRLGSIGTNTLRGDLQRWWYSMRGLPDPTLIIGQENSLKKSVKNKSEEEYVWALKDINFEVKQGEVLGIIGKNGAGKSTLLKLLSRVTAPTTGSIKVKGRIASLLEVGTGFHPDLTGRENIFLNGAILGMTKIEIRSKLEEIVDFAGISKYIDTPVKRYSSGMYVRLAFAVAAHLEPEILIVDEVLAVGDAEFQKKALGKMQNVSQEDGRTVLFVSHNMEAVKTLCHSGLLLFQGKIKVASEIDTCIEEYKSSSIFSLNLQNNVEDYKLDNYTYLRFFSLDKNEYYSDENVLLSMRLHFEGINPITDLCVLIYNQMDSRVGICDLRKIKILDRSERSHIIDVNLEINGFHFVEGLYRVGLFIYSRKTSGNFFDILSFRIKSLQTDYTPYPASVKGVVNIPFHEI